MRLRFLAILALLFLAVAGPLSADQRFIMRCPLVDEYVVASRHGLTVVGTLETPSGHAYVVTAPDSVSTTELTTELKTDSAITSFEPDRNVSLPETPAGLQLNQSTVAILDAATNAAPTSFFGSTVRAAYIDQPATRLIRLAEAQKLYVTGWGTVAVIDTGADPNHPALKDSLVWGYDFTRDLPGPASEWADLDQSTVALLDQSTVALLDKNRAAALNQSTVALLDQSTVAILDGTQIPPAFGHGTMVAGLIHRVAPTARIMPLKAFRADGTSNLSDILRAIYFAVDHGAKVINMSFSMAESSEEMVRALNYAHSRSVIAVASAGNGGSETLVYPAAYRGVLGIASTNNADKRSSFTNYGESLVSLAAPGEGLITTYPGTNNYAAAWGTSFSAPLVSGAVALLAQVNMQLVYGSAFAELEHAISTGKELGEGRLDVYMAVSHAMDDRIQPAQ